MQHGRDLIVVFNRFSRQLVQVFPLQVPPTAEKKSPRLAGRIVPRS